MTSIKKVDFLFPGLNNNLRHKRCIVGVAEHWLYTICLRANGIDKTNISLALMVGEFYRIISTSFLAIPSDARIKLCIEAVDVVAALECLIFAGRERRGKNDPFSPFHRDQVFADD